MTSTRRYTRQNRQLIQVSVFDCTGRELTAAHVALRADHGTGETLHELKFDDRLRSNTASGIAPGPYLLNAGAGGYVGDERRVQDEAAGLRTVILLGPSGLPFLYRGLVKTPFQPEPDLLAIALDEETPDSMARRGPSPKREGSRANSETESNLGMRAFFDSDHILQTLRGWEL